MRMSNYYSLTESNQTEKNYFTLSVIIHAGFFLAMYGMTLTFSTFFNSNKVDLSVIETSIKVDVVAMPTMTVKELKVLSQDNEEWKKIEKEDTKIIQKENFLDTLKKLSDKQIAKIEIKNEDKTKKTVSKKDLGNLKALIAEGNKISKGSNLTGTKNSQEEGTLISNYADQIVNLVRQFWVLPSYLSNQELKCRIRVFINDTGDIIKLVVHESSGTKEYDEQAILAIKQASPFPTSPQEIKHELAKGTIILGFPL